MITFSEDVDSQASAVAWKVHREKTATSAQMQEVIEPKDHEDETGTP